MGVVLLWSGEKNISNLWIYWIHPYFSLQLKTSTFSKLKWLCHHGGRGTCFLLEKKLGSASFYFFWVQQPEESPNLPAEEMSSSANKKSAKWRHLNISTSNFHLKNKKPTNLLLHLSQQEIFFHSKSSTEKSESHLPAPPYLSCYFSINKAKTWCTDSKIPSHRE